MDQLTPDYDNGSKRCPDCGETKPLTEFTLSRKNKDGRGTYCRPCFNKRDRLYREQRASSQGREVRRRPECADGMKFCPRCGTTLPVSSFGRNRSTHDGLTAYCRPCHNQAGKDTRERLYGGSREYHLRRRYGLTSADVDAMIEAQGGTCAVCPGKPEHVDHDHRTSRVRGILCFNCNQALGNARDDVVVLEGLARYLNRHRLSLLRLPVNESPLEGVVFEVVFRHLSA